MANTLPFFPLYAADFLSSETVVLMDNEGVGVYVKLLCRQWIEGSLPDDTAALARLTGEPEESFARTWEFLESRFPAGDDGRLRNPRLADERDKAESIHSRKSQGGKTRKAQRKQDSAVDSIAESSRTPPCDYDCDVVVPSEGGAGGGLRKWQHWARFILDEYPKPGPRYKAMDAACRLIDKISLGKADATVDEIVEDAVQVTKRFAAATKGAGYIPHLATWVDDGWFEMDEEEWASYGRDFKDQKQQDSQKRQDRASVAAQKARQDEAEADEKARQEASEAKERALALVTKLDAADPDRLERLVRAAEKRWPVLVGRPHKSQFMARAIHQLVQEGIDASSTDS